MKGFNFLHKRQKQTWQWGKYGQGQRRTEHTAALVTHVGVQVKEKQGSVSWPPLSRPWDKAGFHRNTKVCCKKSYLWAILFLQRLRKQYKITCLHGQLSCSFQMCPFHLQFHQQSTHYKMVRIMVRIMVRTLLTEVSTDRIIRMELQSCNVSLQRSSSMPSGHLHTCFLTSVTQDSRMHSQTVSTCVTWPDESVLDHHDSSNECVT